MATLGELARRVGGEVRGDASAVVNAASTLRWAESGEIALYESPKYQRELAKTRATALLVPRALPGTDALHFPLIVVDDAGAAFTRLLRHFHPIVSVPFQGTSPEAHVHPTARIDPTATIHAGAWIDANVRIGAEVIVHSGCRIMAGTEIDAHSILFPNVVCYEGTRIGRRVCVHANAVIGAYGFGYTFHDGQHRLGAQAGWVEIHDDVDIGACSTIDRGTYAPTIIGAGTKIDNHVQVAHNCRIGRHNLLCSQVGIAGSCVTGDYVILAGQVGVRDHVDIGEGARLGAKSGVSSNIPAGEWYLGTPARPEKDELAILIARGRIPSMRKQLRALERLVARIARQLGIAREAESSDDEHSEAA